MTHLQSAHPRRIAKSAATTATLLVALLALSSRASAQAPQVRTASGTVAGATSPDGAVQIFKGIPYAAPPVGTLRWQPPQPFAPWQGVRQATEFASRCMQGRIFPDMVFRDPGISEDCLYLNVWTPSASPSAKLPVMVWIYGGGYQAGATSEPRQDGEALAHCGVVVVSMNYRLGIFGFFAHPELTKESPHHASGNYGLLDQAAALQWVRKNIAAFGGDPANVTIFGESAGSFSVSALMASPLSKNLIHRAIGESGAFFGASLRVAPLAQAQSDGAAFGSANAAPTLQQLRAMSAQQLLDAALAGKNSFRFRPDTDGYFFLEAPGEIFRKGAQAHIALLAGWNHDEGNVHTFFGEDAPTKENYVKKVQQTYGDKAPQVLKLFPGDTDAQAQHSAALLATANFIAYGTWKWLELQTHLNGPAVYRYEFDDAPPLPETASASAAASAGAPAPPSVPLAYHSAEIEFVFGALKSKDLPWRPADFALSEEMGAYWTNFAKSGDPNSSGPTSASSSAASHGRTPAAYAFGNSSSGRNLVAVSGNRFASGESVGGANDAAANNAALPHWPRYNARDGNQVMYLASPPYAAKDSQRPQYLLLDSLAAH